MPELPEVETIRKGLIPIILHRRIKAVDILDTRMRWPVQVGSIQSWIFGQTIVGLERRAKYLLWRMENDATLILHLGMSGRLGVFQSEMPVEKHTHAIFHFPSDVQVRFRDPRRFGSIEVAKPDELANFKRFAHLGVEPLSSAFTSDYLFEKSQSTRKPVKNVLMDAQIVVGVGNIYANEALFLAGILPERESRCLSREEITAVVHNVKAVLHQAIAKGGTTLNDYKSVVGEPGFFQLELFVYNKADEPCQRCHSNIQKVVLAGRSSFYCPTCQK